MKLLTFELDTTLEEGPLVTAKVQCDSMAEAVAYMQSLSGSGSLPAVQSATRGFVPPSKPSAAAPVSEAPPTEAPVAETPPTETPVKTDPGYGDMGRDELKALAMTRGIVDSGYRGGGPSLIQMLITADADTFEEGTNRGEPNPKVTETRMAPTETPAAEPAPDPGGSAVPAEMLTYTSFRQVMNWMLANGYTNTEAIALKCEELKPHIPAIGKLAGDITDRISRALEVLQMEHS